MGAGHRDREGRGGYIDPQRDRITLGAFFEREFAAMDLAPATRALYQTDWDLYVAPVLGDRRLNAVTREKVKGLIDGMRKANVGAVTIHTTYRLLRSMLARAVGDGRIGTNPAAGLGKERRSCRRWSSTRRGSCPPTRSRGYPMRCPSVMRARAAPVLLRTPRRRGSRAPDGDLDLMRRRVRISRTLKEVGGRLIEGSTKTDESERELVLPSGIQLPPVGVLPCVQAGRYRPVAAGPRSAARRGDAHVRDRCEPLRVQEALGHSDPRLTLRIYAGVLGELQERTADRLDEMLAKTPSEAKVISLQMEMVSPR